MSETILSTPRGAIVYDTSVIRQISDDSFTPEGWPHAEPVTGTLNSSGRGSTQFVGNVPRQFVLRHFVRGGLVGKYIDDRYLFLGEDRTRSFCEWRLLAKLVSNGLRVPKPAAARYVRHGLTYSADIITVRIPDVVPLSRHICGHDRDDTFWAQLGRQIAEFHAHGVLHADMNAYNLQIDPDGDLWMLDFDRGRIASPGPWQQKTLARLHRSLQKVRGLDPEVVFSERDWDTLLAGYFDAQREG